MPDSAKPPLRNLTIYLVKEEIFAEEQIVTFQGLDRNEIEVGPEHIGRLFVRPTAAKPPAWSTFFSGKVDQSLLGSVTSSSALLLLEVADRIFAITFGQGRTFLAPGCCEERFGLTVVLNSVNPKKLRSIDRKSLDSVGSHGREQTVVATSIDHFSIDVEQDFLSAVTGVPEDLAFGNRLSGADSLHASANIEINDLPELLKRYLLAYKSDAYKDRFPWIDNVAEVKDSAKKDELNLALVDGMNTGAHDRIWLAIPEIIEWGRATYFKFFTTKSESDYSDIRLADFLKELSENVTLDLLKKRKAYCIDSDGNSIKNWPIYKCLYAEVTLGGETFVLTDSKWYRVEGDFVQEVLQSYRNIKRYSKPLPPFNPSVGGEQAYNEAVANSDPTKYKNADCKFIRHGGARSKVEMCDLIADDEDLIHVKRYHSSAVLSHHFAQALVSSELLRSDPNFRKQVREKFPTLLPESEEGFDPSNFEIVLAIISEPKGDLEIPFFSKVNLRSVVNRIQRDGFKVSLAKIEVESGYDSLANRIAVERLNNSQQGDEPSALSRQNESRSVRASGAVK